MKKNLSVLLVVGLMVALLGAPAFAVGHDIEPVDPDLALKLIETAGTISEDQLELSAGSGEVLSEDEIDELTDFDTKSEDYAEQLAEIFNDAGIRPASLDVSAIKVADIDPGASVDVTISGDYGRLLLLVSSDPLGLHWVEVGADGNLKAAADGKAIKGVTDNKPETGDLDPASGEIKFVAGATKDEVEISTSSSSSGGGCDVTAIAPIAGLLMLPLLLLVRR
jgi:Synergist-CTERM protein sorting domain-containing protein